jgi:hypothetical protein
VVEGEGNIQESCKDQQDIPDKVETQENGKDSCKIDG